MVYCNNIEIGPGRKGSPLSSTSFLAAWDSSPVADEPILWGLWQGWGLCSSPGSPVSVPHAR